MSNDDFIICIKRVNGEVDLEIDIDNSIDFMSAIATLFHEVSENEKDAFTMLNVIGQAVSLAYKESIPKSK